MPLRVFSHVSCYDRKCARNGNGCSTHSHRYFSGLFVYSAKKNVKLEHWLPLPRDIFHLRKWSVGQEHLNVSTSIMWFSIAMHATPLTLISLRGDRKVNPNLFSRER